MKIGDLVEVNGGQQGIIVSVELMYPRHPESPPRNFEIMWAGEQPHYAFRKDEGFSTVNAMSVLKVISRG